MFLSCAVVLAFFSVCNAFQNVFRMSSFSSVRRSFVTSATRNTIVFDIDDTLTGYDFEKHPECIEKVAIQNKKNVMFPHFKIVLEYLLQKDCYVSFFSHGIEERNVPLLNDYLSDDRMLGLDRYERLKSEGQFQVFSRQRCPEYKTMRHLLLRDNQTLSDILLVDDCTAVADDEEKPLIEVPETGGTRYNTMYYLLGLFMDYFESATNSRKPLRKYFTDLKKVSDDYWVPEKFAQFAAKGLKEVRKTVPEAVYYRRYRGDQYMVDMKLVTPSLSHINKVLSREYKEGDASYHMAEKFKEYVHKYFVPYYQHKLSEEQKHKLPKYAKKLILNTAND